MLMQKIIDFFHRCKNKQKENSIKQSKNSVLYRRTWTEDKALGMSEDMLVQCIKCENTDIKIKDWDRYEISVNGRTGILELLLINAIVTTKDSIFTCNVKVNKPSTPLIVFVEYYKKENK